MSILIPAFRGRGRRSTELLRSQVHDVDVGSQSYVVCEVPAVVVGVFVDDDVVAVPEPVAAKADVIESDAEKEAAEPETIGAASGEAPDVVTAEAAGEMAVLPGMIEVVVRIVGAGVMADPFTVRMDMRRVRVSGFVAVVRGSWRGVRSMHLSGTVRGDVCGSTADVTAMLGEDYDAKQEACCQKSDEFFHGWSFSEGPGRF